jgi:hypothetical protein
MKIRSDQINRDTRESPVLEGGGGNYSRIKRENNATDIFLTMDQEGVLHGTKKAAKRYKE